MKKQLGPSERLFPMPCPIVVGGTLENSGALAVAWINIVSSTPPTIAMGLRESRNTLELIRATGTFTVNVPTAGMARVVDYLGLASGKHEEKLDRSGLTLVSGTATETPIVAECPFNLECRVVQEVEVGSYVVVFGEVVESHADESVLADPEGDLVDMDKLDPLVYCAGVREYRRLGEKVADAFSIGKPMIDRSSKK